MDCDVALGRIRQLRAEARRDLALGHQVVTATTSPVEAIMKYQLAAALTV